MKLSLKNIHIYMLLSLFILGALTMIWAWWCNDCMPGGDGLANGVVIIGWAIALIAAGLYDLEVKKNVV